MNTYGNAKETMELIKQLVSIPSPSGNTKKVIDFCEQYLKDSNVEMYRNRKGGLIATLPGKNTEQHRMLTAHVDTLGAMVKEVKANGRLKLTMIGGFRWNSVEGEYCKIETSLGKVYSGTILMHQQSVHVYKDAGKAERNEENIEVRIDEKVLNEQDVRALGIEEGDFVSFEPRVEITESGYIKSRHLDDKASAAILLRLIKFIKENNVELPYTTHFLISNNEEIGYGGNSNITPETVEYLAVDMGALGDGQSSDEYTVSICAKDSSGPYHYGLRKHLVNLAKENNIEYKVDIYPFYGSDASAAIRAGFDIVHGLVGPGIESSHAFERTHESSIRNTEQLLFAYVQSDIVPQ
ncbi:M42 family metallopeptidase [Heyndrickxia sporothermodurans]|uniref:M42 family metallopeptidase n=1 Tax=Heyndrickxia sporothermodurans TaxID=46224 RepID=A0AB37H4P1_9BACI|nr:M42 family metallopeptidase [Heyndrickxia sporothermodurans]MBL5767662.1 M42 family metallopeptidase [Heyndrickxia sporothermodurans]MBL5771165.1 M42 family metallopeptidase [Heyndrickxia sporothermodurans]MBL5775033.1 M42 family metallopeptidase [Heyndrickxia sporothermodurans]MBL5778236.1 M42 family metallopeptidase [Heyndrickxia sporothermodurans]MBL5781934.1 M42 family metallopeptidase [Heyndrickxia sporothermodurans]